MAASAVRRRRSAFAAGFATLAMTLSLSAAPAQAAPVNDYVALGDSYAAGQGAGPYLDGCLRSDNAYSEVADALKTVGDVQNVACSGRTTQDVATSQLGELDKKTDLVTITAGGNNIGFGGIVVSCLTAVSDPTNFAAAQACQQAQAYATALIGDGRGPLYGDVVSMIQSVKAAAPKAKIVVTGYPYLFDPLSSPPTDALSLFIQQATILADGLNLSIANAAAATGVEYVDVSDAFVGHGAFSAPADRWINFDPLNPFTAESFHPNAAGYRDGYFASLSAAGAYKP